MRQRIELTAGVKDLSSERMSDKSQRVNYPIEEKQCVARRSIRPSYGRVLLQPKTVESLNRIFVSGKAAAPAA